MKVLTCAPDRERQRDATYDARGLNTVITEAVGSSVQRTTTMAYDGAMRLSSVQDARGNFTSYQYNTLGLVTEIQNALGERVTFSYDSMGRSTQIKDARLNFVTFTYTNRDWLESERDQLGNRTTHTYDTEGNRRTTTDAALHVTTFSYDALNRLESIRDAQNGLTTFGYDAAGNLLNLIDPVGNRTTYAYDAVNQRTKITDANLGVTTLLGRHVRLQARPVAAAGEGQGPCLLDLPLAGGQGLPLPHGRAGVEGAGERRRQSEAHHLRGRPRLARAALRPPPSGRLLAGEEQREAALNRAIRRERSVFGPPFASREDATSVPPGEGSAMLRMAIVFLIVALVAGALGLFRVEWLASEIAWILFVVFLILFVISLVMGRRVA